MEGKSQWMEHKLSMACKHKGSNVTNGDNAKQKFIKSQKEHLTHWAQNYNTWSIKT